MAKEEVKQKEKDSRNFLQKIGDGLAEFPNKHPKITKGLKVAGLTTLLAVASGASYSYGKKKGSKDSEGIDVDTNNYLEARDCPVIEEHDFVANDTIAEDANIGE